MKTQIFCKVRVGNYFISSVRSDFSDWPDKFEVREITTDGLVGIFDDYDTARYVAETVYADISQTDFVTVH
jgi:hypothetical protein